MRRRRSTSDRTVGEEIMNVNQVKSINDDKDEYEKR
jgi:hypothetical protein